MPKSSPESQRSGIRVGTRACYACGAADGCVPPARKCSVRELAIHNDWHFEKLVRMEKAALLESNGDGISIGERRGRRRVPLRCTLSILKSPPDTRDLSTVTENLSSRGFCCVLDQAVAEGDRLACILRFPRRPGLQPDPALQCDARVVWAKALDDSRFEIGCQCRGLHSGRLKQRILTPIWDDRCRFQLALRIFPPRRRLPGLPPALWSHMRFRKSLRKESKSS